MNSSPETAKRKKNLAGTLDWKGKAPISPEPSPDPEDGCGICLSDTNRSIRGTIDCCNHFFCFVCIMEWAKIESRCPLCKQRFGSIRRPPVTGVFALERLVRVPERNQASDPQGDALDPYADVCCTLCHSSANEELLLLCDLCDSAAHTYCVGLGATVPEGDWYCPDCAVLREASQCDADTLPKELARTTGSFGVSGNFVSVYDIVADEFSESSRGTSTVNISQQGNHSPSVRNGVHEGILDIIAEASESGSVAGEVVSSPHKLPNEIVARTLRNCRNLHGRIQVLRDNWTSLRSGSLAFSSELFRYNPKKNGKRKSISLTSCPVMTKQPQQKPIIDNQESVDAKANGKADGDVELQDINKAWKHMEVVRALNEKQKNKISHACHVDIVSPSSGANNSKRTPKMQFKYSSLRSTLGVNTQMSKMESSNRGPPNVSLPVNLKPSSVKIMYSSPKQDYSCGNIEIPLEDAIYRTPNSSDFHNTPVSSCSVNCSLRAKNPSDFASKLQAVDRKDDMLRNADERLAMRDDSGQANSSTPVDTIGKLNMHISSRKRHLNDKKDGSSSHVSEKLRDCNASNKSKDEIQSLVKLNLKLLSKHQNIGSEKFKEVARIATHTILAACGLEHSKSKAHSFSTPVCKHSDQYNCLRKSNLMPNSCRECFYTFVQNVVKSLLSE